MEPFVWKISESDILDMQARIRAARWPEQIPGVEGWSKGIPVDDARKWADELATFDWRGLQAELNGFPQWTTKIDGDAIHFVHVRSMHENPVAILLLHGWPGTVVELLDLIGPLTNPESGKQAFDVVIPSHPGTGLSGPVSCPGWGVPRTARAYARLMSELGYDSYFVQGGDHGAVLAPHMGRVDPAHVRGIHVNAATVGFMPMGDVDGDTYATLTNLEKRRMESIADFLRDGNGYNVIQTTRPQTIGYGLEDSPVAQLTWIIDKVHAWTHSDSTFADEHYRNRHLANVLIYWLTRTATSAADVIYSGYGELFADPQSSFSNSGVPTGVVVFAEDPSIRQFAEALNTIVHWTDVETGGHFAALEQPELLIDDFRTFVSATT